MAIKKSVTEQRQNQSTEQKAAEAGTIEFLNSRTNCTEKIFKKGIQESIIADRESNQQNQSYRIYSEKASQ